MFLLEKAGGRLRSTGRKSWRVHGQRCFRLSCTRAEEKTPTPYGGEGCFDMCLWLCMLVPRSQALRDGFIPYIHTHLASTTAREPHLKHLDMSVPGRKNIPFWGFDAENLAALSSGIGTGYLYYTVFPGSVFPIHCEQGGLGAFNAIVGVLRDHLANMLDIPDDGDDDDDEAVGEQSGSEDEKHSEQRVLAGRETRQDEEEVEKRKRVSSGKEVWKPAMDSGAVLSRVSRDGSKQDDVSRGEHPPPA